DNRYQVISRINRNSGEADIYKVADLQDNDAVKALKLFHRRDAIKDEVVKRLLNQDSPYIADFSACGRVDGRTYLIMPFYGKGSLASFIEQGVTFTAKEIRTFILPSVLEGLKAIHDLGIIHKDLKPGNMMISDDESHIVLIDFGISSVADSSTMVVTQTGKSPFYSAPETATGLFWTGSDYYSLGISLYELYTGTTPYQNAGIDNIALYAQAQRIPYPDDFDAELKDLIDGLTYKDISNRNDPGNPNRRWEYKEVSAWLNGEKPPVPGQNIEEPSDKSVIPYTFKDRKYYSVPEITEAFLSSWEDGKKEVFRGFLTRYFELTDNREALNLTIKAENEAASADANLIDTLFFRLMYELNPDMENFIFKEYSFTGIIEFAENIEKLLTTDNPLIASLRYLILNDCFEVLIKKDPEYSVQKNYLYVVKDLVNTYLDTFSDNGTGSYGNDSDNNKYIALVFTNTLLKHNKILIKNELFDNAGEFLNYLQQMNTADQMNFISYRNANAQDLKKAMFFIPENKKEEFKKLLPWLLPEEESDALYPVHFDYYYFKSHREACSFLNSLKNGDIRLSDTKESCEKASAEKRQAYINNFKNKYRNFLKQYPPAMEEQMEIKQQTGIIINSIIPDNISAGDTIFFGRYENRPIKWQVLQADEYNNRALLMSEKIITRRQYGTHVNNSRLIIVIIAFVIFFIFIYSQISLNQLLAFFTRVFQDILNEFNEDGPRALLSLVAFIGFCTLTFRSLFPVFYDIYTNFVYNDISWSNSKIREWLNSEFLNDAFDRNELQYIIDNTVSPTILNVEISKAKSKQKINFQYEDKVFLLSEDELEYFSKIITIQDPGEIKISDNDDTTYWLSYPVYDNFPRVADKYGKITRRSWR
ncbi:MAG: serine/threonine protein kinase, partial [Ruminobacter sp.]|nr:serine/threonine protein kinase [Ruminobacter sp.]